jgi:hypothetical protein
MDPVDHAAWSVQSSAPVKPVRSLPTSQKLDIELRITAKSKKQKKTVKLSP